MTPDAPFSLSVPLATPDTTTRLAEALAPPLKAGDVLLLAGPIGAGKSHFGRALIRWHMARAGRIEDVPSPTFTLVQVYPMPGFEIWHADLYRLSDPDEVEELGLAAAFDEALCIVEWPDRLPEPPPDALMLSFAPGDGETDRLLTLTGPAFWEDRLAPVLERA